MRSPALASVEKLRRLVPIIEAGDADSKWLAGCLQQYLDGAERGLTVETALDLARQPGQVAWWTEAAIERRDTALRELAARFWPGSMVGSQARAIERLALRYATSAWRLDRERDDMPARHEGTATECLWRAFKSGAAMPIKQRRLESILTVKIKSAAA